jgi:hypothetical protein
VGWWRTADWLQLTGLTSWRGRHGAVCATGDFSELSLTFTATVVDTAQPAAAGGSSSSSAAGPRQREVELKPGGRDIPVRAGETLPRGGGGDTLAIGIIMGHIKGLLMIRL